MCCYESPSQFCNTLYIYISLKPSALRRNKSDFMVTQRKRERINNQKMKEKNYPGWILMDVYLVVATEHVCLFSKLEKC